MNNSLAKFIDDIIQYDDINEILKSYKTFSKKGIVYERLWDIIIKLGFCDIFPKNRSNHLTGNSNNGKLKQVKSIKNYLENNKVSSGNSGGVSDISLYDTETEEFIFISSKYPKDKEDIKNQKSVGYYDIQNIISVIDDNKEIYKKYSIYLLVPNKANVLKKVRGANKSSNYITKYMKETNILDKHDLQRYFEIFKEEIIKYDISDYDNIFLSGKESLKLRFHQDLITEKTLSLIGEGYKSFLWGCKCRSGKTYMTGGLIVKLVEEREKANILIITPAPTETAPQFTDDLFNKFDEFTQFKIHHIKNSKKIPTEFGNMNIIIASKQLLQKYINDRTIKSIKNLKLDGIIFDENHFTGTTELSKQIIDSYSSKNTFRLYLTATYNKPLKEWNITKECQMYWDIEDEQICKHIYDGNDKIHLLKEKHGNMVDFILNKYKNQNDLFQPYNVMPNMNLMTSLFDQMRYEMIKESIQDSKYGFSYDTLLSLNKGKNKFNYEKEVLLLLRYISGSQKETDYKYGDKSIFGRINKICIENESRVPFTQIWFLPPNNINEISICLVNCMMKDKLLKMYDVFVINSKNTQLQKDVKDEINKRELIAKENGKHGLILLVGNMLTLGITLDNCDIVILLNNSLSSDKVFQQMYRCMTEGYKKKFGFVVDLNISRVLNTCVNYGITKQNLNIEDKIKYLIDYHLINIDVDMMESKKINSDDIVSKLMDIWKNDPINSFSMLLRNLDNDLVEFDNDTQKLINKTFIGGCDDKTKLTIELKDDEDEIQEIQDGKEKIKKEDINDVSDNNTEETEKIDKEKYISFTKDILPCIIPLSCILTMKDNNKDFVNMLTSIKENPELIEIFNDQTYIWWNKGDIVNFIIDIVNKYFDKKSNAYNISINFKMALKSLIDRPKELMELINECLKPKDVEKKKFGEVFTPMNLVNDMLDKLDEYYNKENDKSIFEEKDFKWFDPANGMGNFPIAIYLRLMEGLKSVIKNRSERKKHILENMLYMSELNKKNVFVCKQIFDINDEYKLNLYCGDSLEIDTTKLWGVNKFDVIIGNPPYQKDNKKTNKARGGTNNNLYIDFIKYSLNNVSKNGYISLIHPISWRKINSKIFEDIKRIDIKFIALNYGGNYFKNVSVKTDYYILKNNNHNKSTVVEYLYNKKTYSSEFYMDKNMKFIPNIFNSEINSIFEKINKYGVQYECIISSDCHKVRPHVKKLNDDIFKYPLFNTSGNPYQYFSSKQHKHQTKKKVIMSNSGKLAPFYDNGKYGTTQDSMYILVLNKKEGDIIVKTLSTKIFKFIITICQWGNFRNEASLFTFLKYPDINMIDKIDENTIYDYYKFTEKEIKSVDKFI